MRFRHISLTLLVVFGFSLIAASSGYSQVPGGTRPPMFTPQPTAPVGVSSSVPTSSAPAPKPLGSNSPSFAPVSLFGMNLYLTGLERSVNQSATLGQLAAQGGVKWSREELSWANLEPQTKGAYNWSPYDSRLASDFNNGINVVGMLLTTPQWASSNPSAGDWFWYEPRNYNDYFDFVRASVSHWKNQIHVWEIWNEPNHPGTWNCLNNCDRAAHYATLLQGAYAAVKSVDPTARVLIGGLYVHDSTNEGMAFLDQTVAASGGAINFDGLSIHTYMPDRVPESMRPDSIVQNFQYRLNMVNAWIDAHGGSPGEIWITEDGRSTCTGCAYPWSEDDQASMLTRMYGIAAASPRVVQFDYFQFEDKFNNPADLYGAMSIVRDDFSAKPAYNAYKTASQWLDGATFAGPGPQMKPGNNPNQPDSSDFIGFDYRFTRGSTNLHLVWRVNDAVTVNYPVGTAQVDVVDRDGGVTRMTASNGTVPLTISPRPLYVVDVTCNARFSDVCPDSPFYPYIECMASRGIISGYSDGTFRPGESVTRGQLAKIVAKSANIQDDPGGQIFTDVPASSPFYAYINALANRRYMSGYTDAGSCAGTPGPPCFKPGNPATRGQISKIVANTAEIQDDPGGQLFTDVPSSSPFYAYINRLVNRRYMSGYTDAGSCAGTPGAPCFKPGNNATRGQTSKIVTNTLIPGCALTPTSKGR